MNAFNKACRVEEESRQVLMPWLHKWSHNGQIVTIDKGRLHLELQRCYGDIFMNRRFTQNVVAIELKAERCHPPGSDNLFLETWSNRRTGREGWMYTLNADVLLYHFLTEMELIVIADFQGLRSWFCRDDIQQDFREVQQKKYTQDNDTWGCLVPIERILRCDARNKRLRLPRHAEGEQIR